MSTDTFPARVGRYYELACKSGVIRAMDQASRGRQKAFSAYLVQRDRLVGDLDLYRLNDLVPFIVGADTSLDSDRHAQNYLEFLATQAAVLGSTVIREFLRYLDGNDLRCRGGITELLHFQCPLRGELGRLSRGDRDSTVDDALDGVKAIVGRPVGRMGWDRAGEFLNADLLALFRTERGFNLFVGEISCFAPPGIAQALFPDEGRDIYAAMTRDIRYLRSKAIFSPAKFDADLAFQLSEGMGRYLKAFTRSDKEPNKIIQGCANAESFLDMLESHGFEMGDDWQATIAAMTNRAVDTINIQAKNRPIITVARKVYPSLRAVGADRDAQREAVGHALTASVRKSFDEPRPSFGLDDVIAARPERPLVIVERLHGLRNPTSAFTAEDARQHLPNAQASLVPADADLRGAHAVMVTHAMDRPELEAILAAFPGAGKTTTMKEWLATTVSGYVFLYASPRLIVNEGMIQKFADVVGVPGLVGVPLIHTDSHIIDVAYRALPEHPSRAVILQGIPTEGLPRDAGIAFLTPEEFERLAHDATAQQRAERRRTVARVSETLLKPTPSRASGVLGSLAFAARMLIDSGYSQVVAAASIQALRAKPKGGHTTDTFRTNLFPSGCVRGVPTLPALDALAGKCPGVFIMIDEITGDPAGAAFYAEMRKMARATFQRPYADAGRPSPFRVKIAIADGSLNNQRIATRYLADSRPASDRIYIEQMPEHEAEILSFRQSGKDRLYVNANGYPSTNPLEIRYHLMLHPVPATADRRRERGLQDGSAAYVTRLILEALEDPAQPQVLAFVQDKARITGIRDALENALPADTRILLCHGNLSLHDRRAIDTEKMRARVVLMTSMAARGIDFPLTRRIIIEVPNFALERNLMEIIQAIYRGRGGGQDAVERSLDIIVGLTVYTQNGLPEDDAERHLQLQAVAAMNIMLMARTSIHSRLFGSARIGTRRFSMIPCGGKGVEAAVSGPTRQVGDVCRELNKAAYVVKDRELVAQCAALRGELEEIFRDAHYRFPGCETSLLSPAMKRGFGSSFVTTIRNGLGGVVGMTLFPDRAIALGQMLVEPIEGEVAEDIWFQSWNGFDMARAIRAKGILDAIQRRSLPRGLSATVDNVDDFLRGILSMADTMHATRFADRTSDPGSSTRFVAAPVAAYYHPESLAAFQPDPESEVELRIQMEHYLRQHVGLVSDVLPRTSEQVYGGAEPWPFLGFASPNLADIGLQWFSKEHLAATPEFNVMNLILSDSV